MNLYDQETMNDLNLRLEARGERIRELTEELKLVRAENEVLNARLREIADGLGDVKAVLEQLRQPPTTIRKL